MNLKDISTELLKVNAKIDNFTILGVAFMADQKKLLDIALSTQPSTISGPTKRDENNDQTLLWNTIEQLRREMTEQKLFYENQLAESKAEAEQDFEDLRTTLTSKIPEMESKMSSLAEQQLAEERAERKKDLENEKSKIEQTVARQKIEIDKMSQEISALTSKINKRPIRKQLINFQN
jgi:phage shock protein A